MTFCFNERDLQITFNNVIYARRFDGSDHGLSHCMAAIDFVVELPDRIWFIEFTDPDNPRALVENRQSFMNEFIGTALDEELKRKYRDSFLYEWAAGRADKPVYFAVLIAMEILTEENLLTKTEDLRRKLPVYGHASWVRPIVHDCVVFNLALWNRRFEDFQISRLSAQP